MAGVASLITLRSRRSRCTERRLARTPAGRYGQASVTAGAIALLEPSENRGYANPREALLTPLYTRGRTAAASEWVASPFPLEQQEERGVALLHVTGRRRAAKTTSVSHEIRTMSPAERLQSILEQGALRPCNTFYSGGEPVVCFTEGSERYLAELVAERGHAPWGLILEQTSLQQRGVKPVRYLHSSDVAPADDPWRNVRYDHANGRDWYWEREWRWRGDETLTLPAEDILAVVVDDPAWPGPVVVPEMQPDGDVLPAPAVPDWVSGIERFLWVLECGRFMNVGPYTVPPWVRLGVSSGRTTPSERGHVYGSVGASSVVFIDEQDPQKVYQRLVDTVTQTLGEWLYEVEH